MRVHMVGDWNINMMLETNEASALSNVVSAKDVELQASMGAFAAALALQLLLPAVEGAHCEDPAQVTGCTRWQKGQRPSLLDYAASNCETAVCEVSWNVAVADHAAVFLRTSGARRSLRKFAKTTWSIEVTSREEAIADAAVHVPPEGFSNLESLHNAVLEFQEMFAPTRTRQQRRASRELQAAKFVRKAF